MIDGRGVKACIVCDTPAASMNSSLSSELVLPRALGFCFVGGKIQNFLVEKKFSKLVCKKNNNNQTLIGLYFEQLIRQL